MAASPYKLRYMGHDIEIPQGTDFVIGRSAQCQLAVDDPLVSRRHVLVRVVGDGAEVQDLGSRNGVYVNGVRLVGTIPLRPGDRVTLGSQELMLVRGAAIGPSRRETTQLVVCPSCGLATDEAAGTCPHCAAPLSPLTVTLARTTADDLTRTAGVFSLLLGVGDKALARGQVDDATRVFGTFTEEVATRLDRGESFDLVPEATRFALRLAMATGSREPLDWVFRIHAQVGRVPDADVVEALFDAVRKTRYGGADQIARCVEALRTLQGLSAGQRFLLNRLEGLARQLRA